MPSDRLPVRPKNETRREWYKDRRVLDYNLHSVGTVVDVKKRHGDHYLIVNFAGRTQELLLIGDDDRRPQTPHFIREARADKLRDWYRWRTDFLDDPFVEREPGGEYTVTIDVRAAARASADNQQKTVDHFSKVVAVALADILDRDLESNGEDIEEPDIETSSATVRTGRDSFKVTVTVRVFATPAIAEELAPKIFRALETDPTAESFWPQVLRQHGVGSVHASSFTFAGRTGGQRIALLKGRLRLH
jgi:hypothetical protein